MKINQPCFNYRSNHTVATSIGKIRQYSTSTNSDSTTCLPIPVFILESLQDKGYILGKRNVLSNKAGIYSFTNKVNGKQYIGSAKDLYIRLNEHLSNRKSNIALQSAILKYGLENFRFCVFEYFNYQNKLNSSKLLTDLESSYIKRFEFNLLYNYMKNATSLEGYKHTETAKIKMVQRLADKTKHPFWGKHHTEKTKVLISKPGTCNPMYGKSHSIQTKELIRDKKRKYIKGVGIYDLNHNLIKSFDYATDMANYLKVSKVTVSKYINKGLIYDNSYYLKINKL